MLGAVVPPAEQWNAETLDRDQRTDEV